MTHAELVGRAERWLRRTQHCGVVLTEFHSSTPEVPDAIGWCAGGKLSYLIECKTTIADFYADRNKPGRCGLRLNAGIGRLRYYMTEPGLLSVDSVRKHRPKWGLLEVHPRSVRAKLRAEPFALATAWREMPLLYSYVRRIHQYGLSLDDAQRAVANAAEQERAER